MASALYSLASSPRFLRVLCVPASSASVEKVFSQSRLIMKSNTARMTDKILQEVVFLISDGTIYHIVSIIAISRPYRGVSLSRELLLKVDIPHFSIVPQVVANTSR